MLEYRLDAHLAIRLLSVDDTTELFNLVNTNRDYLRRFLPWLDGNRSASDTLEYLHSVQKQFAHNEGFACAITWESKIIGVVGYHGIQWANRTVAIGYWLAEGFQGRGLITRAVTVMVDHAFEVFGLNRVEIRAAMENLPSRRVAERLGFEYEGCLREAEWLYDHFVDLALYSMLEQDWSSLRRQAQSVADAASKDSPQ